MKQKKKKEVKVKKGRQSESHKDIKQNQKKEKKH